MPGGRVSPVRGFPPHRPITGRVAAIAHPPKRRAQIAGRLGLSSLAPAALTGLAEGVALNIWAGCTPPRASQKTGNGPGSRKPSVAPQKRAEHGLSAQQCPWPVVAAPVKAPLGRGPLMSKPVTVSSHHPDLTR